MSPTSPGRFRFLRRLLRRLNPAHLLSAGWRGLRNWRRRRARDLDAVLIRLPGEMSALPQERGFLQRRLFGEAPLSLWALDEIFSRILADPRPRVVVLSMDGLQLSLADLQTLRGMIARLRAAGRQVVCHTQHYDMSTYYVACAADRVLLQPNGAFQAVGLSSEAIYLGDALAQAGVQFEVAAISPYKSAFDTLTRSASTPEVRAQIDWLLDSRYAQLIAGIAEGRGISPEAARALIDGAPYDDDAALAAGAIDGLVYEDDLAALLDVPRLLPWEQAERKLLLPAAPAPHDKVVAVLRIEGLIATGESGGPPGDVPLPIPLPIIGEDRAGDLTVVQQVRALLDDTRVAAVVLMIDSGGGDVTAAANMGQALDALAQRLPMVACMNGVAASGGYWVASAAPWIVAQPGTITGSIGVIAGKPSAGGLLERLHIHPESFRRGENADLFSMTAPLREAQMAHLHASITHAYTRFVSRTASARRMTPEAVDAVGGGRVWTGEQALAHGLVDELGGLKTAIARARERAGLPEQARVVFWEDEEETPGRRPAADALNPAAWARYGWGNALRITSGRPQALLPIWLRWT